MSPWLYRLYDAPMPYQDWRAFPPEAIVQVKNICGESAIGPASSFWWGYEGGLEIEGVILQARRLDRPKAMEPAL